MNIQDKLRKFVHAKVCDNFLDEIYWNYISSKSSGVIIKKPLRKIEEIIEEELEQFQNSIND